MTPVASGDHDAGRLMTENAGTGKQIVLNLLQVGVTDAASFDADQQVRPARSAASERRRRGRSGCPTYTAAFIVAGAAAPELLDTSETAVSNKLSQCPARRLAVSSKAQQFRNPTQRPASGLRQDPAHPKSAGDIPRRIQIQFKSLVGQYPIPPEYSKTAAPSAAPSATPPLPPSQPLSAPRSRAAPPSQPPSALHGRSRPQPPE